MRSLVLGIAVCVAFGITLGQAGAAARSNDRVCSSSSDRGLRLLRESVLRIERRGGVIPHAHRAADVIRGISGFQEGVEDLLIGLNFAAGGGG